jgi:hypothetical protein
VHSPYFLGPRMIEMIALALLLVAAFAFGYHTGIDAANARRDLSDMRRRLR